MNIDTNPLLKSEGYPALDLIRPEHIAEGMAVVLEHAREILESVEADAGDTEGDWEELMAPLEQIDRLFEYSWSPVGHLLGVANSEALREAHEAVQADVVMFSLQLRQSEALYHRLCCLREAADSGSVSLDGAQQRILQRMIRNAELSGIALDDESLEEFNEIEQELSRLGTEFSNHVLDATSSWHEDITDSEAMAGTPISLRRLMAAAWADAEENEGDADPEAGPWRVTLEASCSMPFLQHCPDRDLREKVYRAYITRASEGDLDNGPIIERILVLRQRRAKLLGFENFAALSLSRKMAGTVDAVDSMLERLLTASRKMADRELAELQDAARRGGQTAEPAHWDLAYWSERLREQRFQFTEEELRPYFSLDRVLEGMFGLSERLFGIRVERADGEAPVWHNDVRFFAVLNSDGGRIASFYLDPYSRPKDKRQGAWMDDCIARSVKPEETRLPVAYLVSNGTPPVGDVPALMTFREVETLFHEFGHGLQHMLTTVDYRDAAGINGVEWDAVELPSQFMENWCYHKPTLQGMAVHYETGEVIPDELYDKICRARTYMAATGMLRQLQFGMTDLELHARWSPEADASPFEVHRKIAERTSAMEPLSENRFLCSFQHIFAGGYAAGYYSYKWAEVLSADAFSAFEEAGLDDAAAVAETGRRFRDTVLAEGGSRHPMEIFRDFRGREPSPEPLLRHSGLVPSDA